MLNPVRGSLLAAAALLPFAAISAEAAAPPARIFVSPAGNDSAPGDAAHPLRTLVRAQAAVRSANMDGDVEVVLADGTYALAAPLRFAAADGGHAGHEVRWSAAPGAHPVLSGGLPVAGWTLFDQARGIWVAIVPARLDARQLWVDDRLAQRARIEVSRDKVMFSNDGIEIDDPVTGDLASLPDQRRIEVEATAEFTDRFAPVERIDGHMLVMQQPAWHNNLWGYDTASHPGNPARAHLFLDNALAFLSKPGQWYLDPGAGKLYYKPLPGQDMARIRAVLPRLPYLVSIGGDLRTPVQDLVFSGLRFSHTSWMGPSGAEGYANQQSGSFMTGNAPEFPSDVLTSCGRGCAAFERMRNMWSQIPAAVQVSAARRVSFDGDVFAHLGQIALGIGNDSNATASGVGLGTASVSVTRNVFYDLAGGAILAGGIRPAAHHPDSPSQTNRFLIVRNNRIRSIAKDYKDNAAILSTYVLGAVIIHNDISDATYDGIDIGWGWGMNDAGGNPAYLSRRRGYHEDPANLIYDIPTPNRNVMVAYNRIHDVKQWFGDGGTIYNLSASPNTLVLENYLYDIGTGIGLYLDEGSQGLTLRNNVVDGGSLWLFANVMPDMYPMRVTIDNKAIGNWHNHAASKGWDGYDNNLVSDDHPVAGKAWPAEARRVMDASGIEPAAGPVAYLEAH